MEWFVKVVGGVLIAVVLCQMLAKKEKDFSVILALAVCCMVAALAMRYLSPVMDFFDKLRNLSNADEDLMGIMLKAVGIGILAETVCLICQDGGNASMGKAVQIAASAVILYLSVPLMDSLLELIGKVLGGV